MFLQLRASPFRFEVSVQASSVHAAQAALAQRSCDERQVHGFLRRRPLGQNHQRACFPPLPQAASRYLTLDWAECPCQQWWKTLLVEFQSICCWCVKQTLTTSCDWPRHKVNPSHRRWLWPNCWRCCTTASFHRATSPLTWPSNWAPRSSLIRACPRPTPSRGCAPREVGSVSRLHQHWEYFRSSAVDATNMYPGREACSDSAVPFVKSQPQLLDKPRW